MTDTGTLLKKEFILNGLTCANCAAKIERAANDLTEVKSATLNLVTQKLSVEIENGYSNGIHKKIEDIVRKYEPSVQVTSAKPGHDHEKEGHKHSHEHGHSHNAGEEGSHIIIRLIIGVLIFAAGILSEQFLDAGNFSEYITIGAFVAGYLILGGDVVINAVKNILNGNFFDENFLMTIATIGAFFIGEYAEAVGVMLFYQVGEYFQGRAVSNSKKSIANLMDIRPDYANLKKDGQIQKVTPDTVNIGDLIIIKPGEKVPLDGVVIDGASMLDTAALTGESVPRKVNVGEDVLSGCVNQNGLLTVEVKKTFGESTAAKIIDLVENAASKKAATENFITKFARYYTPAVVGLATLIAVIPPLAFGGVWSEWLSRGLIFLVISCPCALVISIPLSFFGGIGGASRKGILVKGGNYLEALANLDIVVFDKTGTLTKGVFEVTKILPASGRTRNEVLELAAKAEAFSNHPIALSISKAYEKTFGKAIDRDLIKGYEEIAGHGVSVKSNGMTITAGNDKMIKNSGTVLSESNETCTKVYIAVNGEYAGCIMISDEIKPDSRAAIKDIRSKGVRKLVMLTGDNAQTANVIAKELELDEVYAGLLPQQKVEKVELLNTQKRAGGKLAFVGDGINDAPVLALADVGVAMGGLGSDAAIEAADVVLMTDEPSKLSEAVDVARFTKRIVWQNIIFALSIKAVFLLLGAFGVAGMWEAVFADVGVALLAVLNAMRVMKR